MTEIFERKLHAELKKWIDKKTIVVLTGIRQSGKTTLMRMLFDDIRSKNKVFLDVENPIVQQIFDEADYNNIWENLKPYGISVREKAYVFLDEMQAMPEIVKAVKYLFDHYDVQFFVTGSSSFYLKNLFPESLAGRKTAFELYPLDFEEFLVFRKVPKEFHTSFSAKDRNKNRIAYERTIKLYEEYLKFGGFPKVALAEAEDEKKAIIEDIYKSYFEKDVRMLSDFKDIRKLQELILLLMKRAGSKINISRLASELGMSRETVYSYLAFLEATYFVSLIKPFSRSVDREVSGARKVYLCDTGILNRFVPVPSGVVLENAVFNTIKKFDAVNYYERRTGKEIDFVLRKSGTALEVKEKGTEFDKRRLMGLVKSLKLKAGFVVTKSFVEGAGFICASDV